MSMNINQITTRPSVFNEFSTNPIKNSMFTGTLPTQVDSVETNKTTQTKDKSIQEFYEKFDNKSYEKKYNSDLDIILVKKKNTYDGAEYIIENNGMVRKLDGKTHQSETIIEQDENLAKFVTKQGKKATNNENKTSIKEKFANVWKFFRTMNTMIGATFKGLFYGAMTGAATLGLSWVFNSLPQAFAKEGPKFVNVLTKPLKYIPKSGKIIAAITGLAVLATNLVMGKLKANKRTADVDHQLNVGHRDK